MTRAPAWQPKPEDYHQVVLEQNPWHLTGEVPEAWAKSSERPLATQLWRRMIDDRPHRFQLVLGPRRVGKTTSMYQTVRHLLAHGVARERLMWFRLDHPLFTDIPLGEIVKGSIGDGASGERPTFLFLDELTYAPDWDRWLKTFYDDRWPVTLVGTSSSTAALRQRRVESGVGRWEEQYLAPYLFPEYLELIGKAVTLPIADTLAGTIEGCIRARVPLGPLESLRRRFLLTGGFPELLAGYDAHIDEVSTFLESQRVLKSDAVERAIYKDIPQAFGVDNPLALERLLYTLAGQVTGVVSAQTIGRGLSGLSQPTVDRYISLLERAFMIFMVPNFSGSEGSVQRRGRKLYFVDGAVRNAALQRGLAPLSDPTEMGVLLENVMASHLHALSQQTQIRLYHWREGNKYEVDFIYDHPEQPMAFEVGSSPTHSRNGLHRLIERYPRFAGNCYLVAPSVTPMRPHETSDGVGMLPLDLALLAIGGQAARTLEARLAPAGPIA